MRTVKHFVLAGLTLGVLGGLASYQAADTAKPKFTIEEIMGKAHEGKQNSLLAKVAGGKANADQKKELLGLYEDLAKNKPEKGAPDSWKKKTTALVSAAKDVVDGKADGGRKLRMAANCKACHEVHKP
ncbi:MAG TPA: hypothetical protein VFE78_30010 [Gemmataceae bacterium]|jgi:hypothetical protein|nr:hypothetical protein [Gemmataceae bacterium]